MGWTFNVVDPRAATSAPTIAALGIFFTVLSALVVSLRLYVRGSIVKTIGIDDWIIVGTWLLSFIFVAITLAQTRWGLGLHNSEAIPPENIYYFGLLQYTSAPFYICAILGFKLSILSTFLRLATDRLYRFRVVGLAIVCSMFHFCFFVVLLHLCNPTAKQWDHAITTGTCLPTIPLYTAMSVIMMMFEILIILTPIPVLLNSVLNLRKNIFLGLIFILAAFLTSIQIIRLVAIQQQSSPLDTSTLLTWSMIETNLGIIVVSLFSLSPLLKSFLSSELDTFKLQLKIDHAKIKIREMGRNSLVWQRLVMFLGYGQMKREQRTESAMESRSGSRMDGWEWGSEDGNWELGIVKTTEVIISREGSTWNLAQLDHLKE